MKTIGLLLLVAILISFPFFKIKYFETYSSLKLIYHKFLIPILIISTLATLFLYSKYLRKFNAKTNSKIKIIFQDIFTVTFLTLIFSGLLCGLTVSTIVTTNAYLGQPKVLTINEPVIKYEPYTTRWGRLRHYIDFKNPIDNSIITLEVYRKYNVGETFIKEMSIGKWGQLYSMK